MKVPLTLRDHIDRAAAVYPHRTAVVDEPDQPAASWGSVTYAQLDERARAQAAALDAMGVPQGARVAMVSHNSARLFCSFYGVSNWGRIFVPVNFRLNKEEVGYIVQHCGADVLLIDPELSDSLKGVEARRTFVMGEESDAELFRFGAEPRAWAPDEDATATINYTSGTTARPKGVEQTHRSLWVNAATFGWQTGVNDRDVYLHTLPMFHCNGWGMPYATTGMGATNVVLRKVDGAEILRRVERHGVTLLCGAPAVVAAILDAAAEWDGPVPGKDRVRMVVAGAPPPTRTIERMETDLGWEFIQIYGLTETAPLLTMNRRRAEYDDLTPTERAQQLGRAGAPALGVRLAVSKDGEVLARSNVVLRGYWDQPEATADAVKPDPDVPLHAENEWFYTGDGGSIDDENFLSIQDRKKDVIISGGENVSSIEVEDVIFSHPSVAEVAVIGVPHEKWGETVKALVVLAAGSAATEQEIIAYTRERMTHYKCPTSVEFRDELARTATGKLQKFILRSPYWEGLERQVN
ncbi:MAG: AMP-binding protein [Acidimicrobiia bacterium]|nr:AMP-binding protein [Acidimicrobiia bacterium]